MQDVRLQYLAYQRGCLLMLYSQPDVAKFGVFELHLRDAELRRGGGPTRLPPQPSRVLSLLVSRAGQLVTREDIRLHVWSDGTVVDFEQGLNHCIRQIRAELNDAAERPLFIETVPRRGYRFIAPITMASPLSTPLGAGDALGHSEADVVGASQPLAIRRFAWVVPISVLAIIAVALLWRVMAPRSVQRDDHPVSKVAPQHGNSASEVAQPALANSSAQLAYIKGRFYWNKRTPEGLSKAVEYFQLAVEKDPNSALAYAGLADTYDLLGYLGTVPPSSAYPKATAAALRALQLDSSLAEAHASLADIHAVHDWQWADAEREYRRAIELKPRYATAHQWYATFLSAMGRHEEAIAEDRRALDLDPLSLIINVSLGRAYFFAGQYDNAVERFQATVDMDPAFVMAHANLGQAYQQKGMLPVAIAELQRADALSGGNPRVLAALAHAYAVSGKRSQAIRIAERLKRLRETSYVSSFDLALIYAGLNDANGAFDWLQRAYKERNGDLIFLKVEPRLAALRHAPKFLWLLERIGLPP